MRAFLTEQSTRFGFAFGIQATATVAARLAAGEAPSMIAQLTRAEALLAAGWRVQKRKVEWLAGRMAAKAAFVHFTTEQPTQAVHAVTWPHSSHQVSVLRRSSRAPYLAEHPALHVSISHSHAYAVAVIAGFTIGVDIEKIEPRPDALLERFFCPDERLLIEQRCQVPGQRDMLVTQLWSRKEAVAKYLGVGGGLDFRQINTAPDYATAEALSDAIRLVSEVCDGYCISLALPAAM